MEATESLLGSRDLHEITIAEIVEKAGTSVGAFYKRFATKDDLAPYLLQRYYDDAIEATAIFDDADRWIDVPLEQRVRGILKAAVSVAHEKRGILRAIFLRQNLLPAAVVGRERKRAAQLMDRMRDFLLMSRDEITHPDPRTATRLAVFFAVNTVRDHVLFRESTGIRALGMREKPLVEELTRAVMGYLGAPVSGDRTQ